MAQREFDAYTGCSSLQTVWVAQASARQRRGRAGRVRAGVCYHLFSRQRLKAMDEFAVRCTWLVCGVRLCSVVMGGWQPSSANAPVAPTLQLPELLRTPLEELALQVKLMERNGCLRADSKPATDDGKPAGGGAGAGAGAGVGSASSSSSSTIETFLLKAMQPPDAVRMGAAVKLLRDIGALPVSCAVPVGACW